MVSDPVAIFNDLRYHHEVACGLPTWEVEEAGLARLALVLDGDVAVSGFRAPWGGADFRGEPTVGAVDAFWRRVRCSARANGAGALRVRTRSGVYGAAQRLSVHALLRLGLAVETCWLDHAVDVRALRDRAGYERRLGAKGRNMLRATERLGVEVAPAEDDAAWRAGFAVLGANKAAKGRTMAYGVDHLLRLRDHFPAQVRMVLSSHAGAVVAAAVTYRVQPDVELVTAWGDAHHELPRSPMNQLAAALVQRAIDEDVAVLDLGPSTDRHAVPDPGLARFKSSVGADAHYRLDLIGSTEEAPA